jgi:apolipoprotein N-acyltransferase
MSARYVQYAIKLVSLLGLGAVAGAGFALSYGAILTFFGLAALAFLLVQQSAREHTQSHRRFSLLWARFKTGLVFGIGFFASTGYWLYFAFHDVAAMPPYIALLVAFGIFVYLALYQGLATLILLTAAQCFSNSVGRFALIAFPSAWVLCEWLRASAFTGLPWAAIGYAGLVGLDSPCPEAFSGISQTLGIYGRSWLIAFVAGLGSLVLLKLSRTYPMSPVTSPLKYGTLTLLTLLGLGWWLASVNSSRLSPSGQLSVALLQGNTPQTLKWRPEERERIATDYYRMILNEEAQLVVLPETAIPLVNHELPPEWFDAVTEAGVSMRGDVIVGIVTRQKIAVEQFRHYNSIITLGASNPQIYSKSRLLLIGEFTPAFLKWILKFGDLPMTDFSRGDSRQKLLELSGVKIASSICYEDLFGEDLRAQLPEAEIVLNISNFAWFGKSNAAEQHLQMGRHRSVELGRWSLRAANTGVTAVINQQGAVVARLPEFEKGVLRATVTRVRGTTLYVLWGDMLMLAICSVLLAGCCVWQSRS